MKEPCHRVYWLFFISIPIKKIYYLCKIIKESSIIRHECARNRQVRNPRFLTCFHLLTLKYNTGKSVTDKLYLWHASKAMATGGGTPPLHDIDSASFPDGPDK